MNKLKIIGKKILKGLLIGIDMLLLSINLILGLTVKIIKLIREALEKPINKL